MAIGEDMRLLRFVLRVELANVLAGMDVVSVNSYMIPRVLYPFLQSPWDERPR